jgi:hypothetical protein
VSVRPGLVAALAALLASCAGEDAGPTARATRYALRGRWDAPAVTFRVDEGAGPLPEGALGEALERALRAWGPLTPLELVLAPDAEAPDVVVSWQRGEHGPCPLFGVDPSLAHAGPVEAGTYLHVDADRPWAEDGGVLLRRTVLHEVGHLLGLDHGPDEETLMYPDPTVDAVTPADRDAVWTLYGGAAAGPQRAGALAVRRGGEELWVLHGIGVPDLAEYELFDTDGDGDDELVCWRTDAAGNGELVVFHFGPGPRPVRTMGPRVGMTVPGADVALVSTEAGERLLVLTSAGAEPVVRAFDDQGRLVGWAGELPPLGAERRREGDLDGDGVRERVESLGS